MIIIPITNQKEFMIYDSVSEKHSGFRFVKEGDQLFVEIALDEGQWMSEAPRSGKPVNKLETALKQLGSKNAVKEKPDANV